MSNRRNQPADVGGVHLDENGEPRPLTEAEELMMEIDRAQNEVRFIAHLHLPPPIGILL
ncbi:hypothetical protein BOX15_Mlig011916g1 [Macrostomum lignano]|uniref:Uncharacterized protein n=1 Tax=Macrostomum lignano TaxID=282301 RepID=A0A267F2U8_9PLAT|nr:hypothetical protein BOX15_Mlig011916g1 [Macrostomum lignano]